MAEGNVRHGRGSRILAGFANVVLDRGLPRIKSWLRERLGDGADLGSLRMEGTRARLRDVRLPFGDAVVWVDDALLRLDTTNPKAPRLCLVELRGEVRSVEEESGFRAPIELVQTRDDDPAAWVHGTLRIAEATWAQKRGRGESHPLSGSVDVRITLERWKLSDGHVTGSAAEIWVEAEGAMDNSDGRAVHEAKLVFKQARAGHLVDGLAALTKVDPSPTLPVPWSALLTGAIAWSRSGKLEIETSVDDPDGRLPAGLELRADVTQRGDGYVGDVALTSDASTLELSLRVAGPEHALGGTTLKGHVALADLDALGLFRSDLRPAPAGVVVGELAAKGVASSPTLSGTLHLDELDLVSADRTGFEPIALRRLRGELTVDRAQLRLENVTATAWGSQLAMTAWWTFGEEQEAPLLRLRLVEAGPELVQDLGRLPKTMKRRLRVAQDGPRPDDEMWISRDARVSGELELRRDLATRGAIALETRDTALLLSLDASADGTLDGTTLAGRVSVHDALLLGMFDTPVRPLPEGSAKIDARLVGTWSSPKLRGRIISGPMRLDAGGVVLLDLDRVQTSFVLDEEAFVCRDLVVEAYGGFVHGEGVVGFTEAFSGYDAELTFREIRAQDLPLDRKGERRLGHDLRGVLRGELHLQRRDAQAPMRGRGELTLDRPEYPVVGRLAGRVKELGLPLPKTAGTKPMTLELALADGGIGIAQLDATLDGLRLEGRGGVTASRALSGGATIHLSRQYLAQSALLTLPSWFTGDLAVPVAVSGTLASPVLDANVRRAVSDALAHGPVGSVVTDVSQGLASAIDGVVGAVDDLLGSGHAKTSAKRPPDGDAELEALVDRIMKEDPDTDRLIDALLDAGVTSDDIVRVLERRRMRF